jgi:hypothetical protein
MMERSDAQHDLIAERTVWTYEEDNDELEH